MSDKDDRMAFNQALIDEFRANDGKVGGPFAGAPLLLLTTTGVKSGQQRTSPVVYTKDGENFVIIASKGGAPEHPQWFHNLVANPDITIEVGTDTIPVRARVAEGDERARLYRAQADLMPNFDDYAKATTREIPVVVLEPAS